MKILDLINIDEFNQFNQFNQFKTLVKKRYSSFMKDGSIFLNISDIYHLYNFEKSCDECIKLIKIWIHYGLVDKYDYYEELIIKIYF
jgi:hypothetical protein